MLKKLIFVVTVASQAQTVPLPAVIAIVVARPLLAEAVGVYEVKGTGAIGIVDVNATVWSCLLKVKVLVGLSATKKFVDAALVAATRQLPLAVACRTFAPPEQDSIVQPAVLLELETE